MSSKQLNVFDQPPPEESEAEIKNAVLDSLEMGNKSWLELARRKARWYCHQNKGLMKYGKPYTVTIDDVRRILNIENSGARRSNMALGSVFRDKRFQRVGFFNSQTKGSHSRPVTIWQLKCGGSHGKE